ncbi:hypothetical protein [Saccharibacillus kuerlensis]|uniref:Uncharacterized protein n=1 Tax=Saccharibacillus kuerlensis TaxID=459527 RepID=A0ABQ2LDI5_9BACL|nr:hypothetical protein [Saccharibacillus kuerlensis]GGO09329.1 hypothetical protein GCM10010969_39660 [Saccharibacillus kuerlensis]
MSFEYRIAADRPIPEVELEGLQCITVKDAVEMGVPSGIIPWEEMNENAAVVYTADPKAVGSFSIISTPEATNWMQKHTALEHIYRLEISGDVLAADFAKDLFAYITTLDEETEFEIWHLWTGYNFEDEPIYRQTLLRPELKLSDFERTHHENYCLRILKLSDTS